MVGKMWDLGHMSCEPVTGNCEDDDDDDDHVMVSSHVNCFHALRLGFLLLCP